MTAMSTAMSCGASNLLGGGLDAKVLVLNRYYSAIRVIDARRAFLLLAKEIAEVIAVDDDALVHLLNDSIRSIPGVTEVETFLYLKLSKQTYNWGTK